jgi:hypothetical protein
VKKMKKIFFFLIVALFLLAASSVMAAKPSDKGFDKFVYNYQARIFVGLADGVDRVLDGKV